MSPIRKGMVLGALNVVVVVVGFAAMVSELESHPGCGHSHQWDLVLPMLVLGMLPGLGVGAVLGRLAGRMRERRLATLAAIASGTVLVLGLMTNAPTEFTLLACIPTLVGTAILERWTRAEPPKIPPATVST